ncbi:3-hydroxyacyl-ACP dehydratase FabZ [Rhodobacteraceae bacterium]|nr:3-hydroxyacyl-ACP dehydratase FabZ [Paracoccaceae bacterium]
MTEPAPYTEADLTLIKRMIPHRYPFLLIDKVVDIVPNKSGVGIKNVTANEPHFEGHFPQEPVMPGVLIVEAMAQTAAVITGITMNLVDKDMSVYFMAMDKVKFRRKVVPGDVLKMHLTLLRGGGKVWKFDGKAMVDGEVACQAELTAMMAVSK